MLQQLGADLAQLAPTNAVLPPHQQIPPHGDQCFGDPQHEVGPYHHRLVQQGLVARAGRPAHQAGFWGLGPQPEGGQQVGA